VFVLVVFLLTLIAWIYY